MFLLHFNIFYHCICDSSKKKQQFLIRVIHIFNDACVTVEIPAFILDLSCAKGVCLVTLESGVLWPSAPHMFYLSVTVRVGFLTQHMSTFHVSACVHEQSGEWEYSKACKSEWSPATALSGVTQDNSSPQSTRIIPCTFHCYSFNPTLCCTAEWDPIVYPHPPATIITCTIFAK